MHVQQPTFHLSKQFTCDCITFYSATITSHLSQALGKDDFNDIGVTRIGQKIKVMRALADLLSGKTDIAKPSVKDELVRDVR